MRTSSFRLAAILLGIILLLGGLLFVRRTPPPPVQWVRNIPTNAPWLIAEFRVFNSFRDAWILPELTNGFLTRYVLESSHTNQYLRMGAGWDDPTASHWGGRILYPGDELVLRAAIDHVQPPWRIILPFKTVYPTNPPSPLRTLKLWAQSRLSYGGQSRPVILCSEWIQDEIQPSKERK